MDRQEVFNKVYKHMMAMTAQSWDVLNGCSYRGQDNNKCAIGCLINDEFYDVAIEGRSIRSKEVLSLLEKSGVAVNKNTDDVMFLHKLQDIHDHYFSERKVWLAYFAEKYKLTIPTE